MKKIYYAHPLSLYGSTQELRDIDTLKNLGFEVLNPNTLEHDAGYKREGMAYFNTLVRTAEVLAFRAFPDGSIPAGVSNEIEVAVRHGMPVIELPHAVLRRTLSVDETREYLKEMGQR